MKKRAEKGPSDIWFNDITVLFDVAFLLDIVPKVDMTLGEKVNAITRFAFYLAILLAVVKQKDLNAYKLESFKLNGGRIYCFTDGFSECMDENNKEIGVYNDFIGKATNNVAEYLGLYAGLKACADYNI